MAAEADLAAPPHPRERDTLVGHDVAVAAFADAIAADKLHHAWLIGGTPGIGKATLAYRVARALLARPEERRASGGLDVDTASRTFRQVAARSHPNLMVLERAPQEGDKAAPRTIPVEAVRRALTFFGSTSADGGHRVCIVDSVEELTLPGANALLKTIEEPPRRATVLLVSHAPQRVLATIRSRCRKLMLGPLGTSEATAVIRSLGSEYLELDESGVGQAVEQADGSVGRALALLEPKRMALVREVGAVLDQLPRAATGRILALADRLADRRAEGEFQIALDAILRWASARLRERAGEGARRLAALASVCENVADTARTVETYNLDRRPFVVSTFADLADAVRQSS